MKYTQALTDKLAIGLSVMCAIHCLLFPFTLALIPSMAALPLNDEAFHFWMLIAVIPTSTYALSLGCQSHKRYRVLALGGCGLALLTLALLLSEKYIGASGEKILTLLGATLIALGHWFNYQYCRSAPKPSCQCH